MFYLTQTLNAWDTDAFNDVLNKELCSIDSSLLPLQQGLAQSNYAIDTNLSVSLLNAECDETHILVKAGLFYTGVVSGCSCADDPSPVIENNEYCTVLLSINKKTAATTVNLID